MSTLAKFLEAKEPLFDHALRQLEQRTGKKGVDASLAAEIAEQVALHTRQLGLSQDCTGPELYQALIAQVKTHDEHLARSLGGQDPTNIAEMIPLIVQAVKNVKLPDQAYVLKSTVAIDMLKAEPPTSVMARLNYATVGSLIQNENIFELMLSLRFAEDADWLNRFDSHYATLTPSDFESRSIETVIFDPTKWGDIAADFIKKKFHNITHSKEMGAIGVMPMTATHMAGVTLKVLPLLVHYNNEIRLYSAFFKLMRLKHNFGEIIAQTLIADPSHVNVVEGSMVHWRVIQRYFGRHPEGHPEIFEPHLQPEDLHWRRAEEVIYDLDPELAFWQGQDFVAALKNDEPVSFNLVDNSFSYSNATPYEERKIYHFRESLWNEVFARYLGQKNLEEQLLIKLNNNVIKPEELTFK